MGTRRPLNVIPSDRPVRAQRRLVGLRHAGGEGEARVVKVLHPSIDLEQPVGSQGPLNLVVRNVRITDLRGLARISPVRQLNQPEQTLGGYSPLGSTMRAIAPVVRSRPHLFVASVEDRLVGFVEFQPTAPDR